MGAHIHVEFLVRIYISHYQPTSNDLGKAVTRRFLEPTSSNLQWGCCEHFSLEAQVEYAQLYRGLAHR